MEKITSTQNKLIKYIKKLSTDKKYRDETNCFVAETGRAIDTLIANEVKCQNLVIANNSKYIGKISYFRQLNISVEVVANHVYEMISSLANADGIIAVFRKPSTSFEIMKDRKYIVLDRIQNPGNLGSIIRTAVALNIAGIVITNESVDLFHPTIIRSTMGSLFSIPVKFSTSLTDTIQTFKKKGFACYATGISKNAKQLDAVKFFTSSVVVFGNEGNGLNKDDIKICDELIYIPINDKVNSLNVATASAIIMFKMMN
ncbi:MAG: RNA methyltransferase [Mycoplasmataceae bacterium]|jgi:TrmH family RNA methyltransferase|nr:RNA methyltransferase [Mycoplasmataceae bacterium]